MTMNSIDDIFKAEAKNPADLLSRTGEYFYIPAYQRDYAWTRKQNLRRLVDDVVEGLAELVNDEATEPLLIFIGALILVDDRNHEQIHPQVQDEVPASVYVVIDGQQRITSLVLWAAALFVELRPLLESLRTPLADGKWRAILTHADSTLNVLVNMLHESQTPDESFGTYRYFPRLIRSHEDQWSRKRTEAKYVSPVGRLLRAISEAILSPPKKFSYTIASISPSEQARHRLAVDAFNYFRKRTVAYANGKEKQHPIRIEDVVESREFQDTLWGSKWRDETRQVVKEAASMPGSVNKKVCRLVRLTSLARFVMTRVCFTAVRSKGDAYAFDMFDALNTTGEPLTAYETFKPVVIEDVGLSSYRASAEYQYLEKIDTYIAIKPTDRVRRTEKLVIHAGLHESGIKGTKRLSEQRRWLRSHYTKLPSQSEKQRFLQGLVRLTDFQRFFEAPAKFAVVSASEPTRLCIDVLASAKHDIVVPLLTRFYEAFVAMGSKQGSAEQKELESAILAVTAFSTLWRLAQGGTAGIDGLYRALMKGRAGDAQLPAIGPFCERPNGITARSPSAVQLKSQMLAILKHKSLGTQAEWVAQSAKTPCDEKGSRVFAKFFLAAAMNDAVVDPANSTKLTRGHAGVCDMLRPSAPWFADKFDLEHIAPKNPSSTTPTGSQSAWSADLYLNPETKQLLGNLTLLPASVNRAIKNSPWAQKQAVYRLLTATTTPQAESQMRAAQLQGDLSDFPSLSQIVSQAAFHKYLEPLAGMQAWAASSVQTRTENLCELGYAQLIKWLS